MFRAGIVKAGNINTNGQIAQLVEQRTENPRVGSSILPLATTLFNVLRHLSRSLISFLSVFCLRSKRFW